MKSYTTAIGLMQLYCYSAKKWAVFYSGLNSEEPSISAGQDEWDKYIEERAKALIFIDDTENYHQIMMDGEGFCIFDTKEEVEAFYDMIVGDDGPTKSNPYNGPIRVYALTCGPNGLMNENT